MYTLKLIRLFIIPTMDMFTSLRIWLKTAFLSNGCVHFNQSSGPLGYFNAIRHIPWVMSLQCSYVWDLFVKDTHIRLTINSQNIISWKYARKLWLQQVLISLLWISLAFDIHVFYGYVLPYFFWFQACNTFMTKWQQYDEWTKQIYLICQYHP